MGGAQGQMPTPDVLGWAATNGSKRWVTVAHMKRQQRALQGGRTFGYQKLSTWYDPNTTPFAVASARTAAKVDV